MAKTDDVCFHVNISGCVAEGIDEVAEFFGVVKALGAHSDFVGLMYTHCLNC